MKKELSVIVLNYNGKNDTLHILKCLKEQNYPHFHVIVVDNDSKDGSQEAITRAYPEYTFLETHANLGFAGGNNHGIIYALQHNPDYILLLNNDTEIERDFLSKMMLFAKEKPEAGITGPKVVSFNERSKLDHMGGMWSDKACQPTAYAYQKKVHTLKTPIALDYISGCSMLIKREVFETIGLLYPPFFLLWEETDFCARAKRKGFEIWLNPNATLYHKVSASFEGKAQSSYYWWRNRLLYMKRNLPKKKYHQLFRKVLLKEMIKVHRHYALKSTEMLLLKWFMPKKVTEKKRLQMKRLKSSIKGIYKGIKIS